jgi:hypothetical protein
MLEEINTFKQLTACTSFGSPRKLPHKTVLNGFKLFGYRFRLICPTSYTKTKWLEPELLEHKFAGAAGHMVAIA